MTASLSLKKVESFLNVNPQIIISKAARKHFVSVQKKLITLAEVISTNYDDNSIHIKYKIDKENSHKNKKIKTLYLIKNRCAYSFN